MLKYQYIKIHAQIKTLTLITLKIIVGLIFAGIVSLFIANALIEQNKIKRYSWSKLARSAGKLAFPKSDVVINAYQLEQSKNTYTSNSLSKSYIQRISNKLTRINLKKLSFKPKLIIILVGNKPDSLLYTNMKMKKCEKIGLSVERIIYSIGTHENNNCEMLN